MHGSDTFKNGAPAGRNPSEAGGSSNPKMVSAGFGSPGVDATVKRIDLNDALILHPQATFVVRAAGTAMLAAGIDDGDVLLVDRAVQAAHGHVVVAVVEGELIVRRLWTQAGTAKLQAASADQVDIAIAEGDSIEVWGVVTTVIKSLLA